MFVKIMLYVMIVGVFMCIFYKRLFSSLLRWLEECAGHLQGTDCTVTSVTAPEKKQMYDIDVLPNREEMTLFRSETGTQCSAICFTVYFSTKQIIGLYSSRSLPV